MWPDVIGVLARSYIMVVVRTLGDSPFIIMVGMNPEVLEETGVKRSNQTKEQDDLMEKFYL